MELPPVLHEYQKMYKLISEKIKHDINYGLILFITKKFKENIVREIEDKGDYKIICDRILDEFDNYFLNNSREKILLEIEKFQQIHISEKNVKPKILSINDTNLDKAVDLLKNGKLVAFPTETVYGLGANGLNSEAVKLIYKWKGRPSNNPVILHIAKLYDIYNLIDISSKMINIINIISEKFWPGPLTIVVKASDIVPLEVTANTGFVGIRIPNDSVALKLLDKCDFPIAAPSANLSGHVSPTNYSHVYIDFINKPLTILEDSENYSKRIGIESSIIKIEESFTSSVKLTVLRSGFIGGQSIKQTLEDNGFSVELIYYERVATDEEILDVPGQLFRHYAPNINAYVHDCNSKNYIETSKLKNYVILGSNKSLYQYKDTCLEYIDIGNNVFDVAKNLYDCLRKAEDNLSANGIIISIELMYECFDINTDIKIAILDKLMRCTEAKSIFIK